MATTAEANEIFNRQLAVALKKIRTEGGTREEAHAELLRRLALYMGYKESDWMVKFAVWWTFPRLWRKAGE